MALSPVVAADELGCEGSLPNAPHEYLQGHASAVSWGAIVAGATAMAALSLILLILGTGLGLSSVSPWVRTGISATTFGVSTILWVTFTQLVASVMGGYLAGRLRTRWVGAQADEVYFRDTAHGFLAWAVASLATAALLTSVIGTIVGDGLQAGGVAATAPVGSEQATFDRDAATMGYFVDSLFRADPQATDAVSASPDALLTDATAPATAEAARLFSYAIRTGTLSAEDRHALGQMVAQRTGLTQEKAERRVSAIDARLQAQARDTETAARAAADSARKASATASLWLFIALLSGAFVASFTAIYGGRQRDL